ncbi:hypothetical protein WA158_001335 [Blastocystis sp. Blastoise]
MNFIDIPKTDHSIISSTEINMIEEQLTNMMNAIQRAINVCSCSSGCINDILKKSFNHNDTGEFNYLSYFNDQKTKHSDQKNNNEYELPEYSENNDNYEYEDTKAIKINFSNSSVTFMISQAVLDSIEGSFIYEESKPDYLSLDGCIFLDYRENCDYSYYLIDYLNNKEIKLDDLSYEQQLELIDLFEFCEIPLHPLLCLVKERQNTKEKKYNMGDQVKMIINNKDDQEISNYLIKNDLWERYIMNYNHGLVDYNSSYDYLYIKKDYTYMNYINQYINNNCIDIDENDMNNIDNELLMNEMYELFDTEGANEVYLCLTMEQQFANSSIILNNKQMDFQLQKWLGKEKKWKLLFRASENHYSASEFHRYCDNQGETVTIIKHIGHYGHINIFGGYTDQSWESKGGYKHYSKEFLFTLSNEHGIPPTKYDYSSSNRNRGIYRNINYGPTFGEGNDIAIVDQCDLKYSRTNFQSFSCVSTKEKNSLFVNTSDSNSTNNFKVADYEVWGKCN